MPVGFKPRVFDAHVLMFKFKVLLQVLSKVFQLSPGKEAWSWWSTCRHSWIGQRQLQVVHIFHNLQRRLFIFLSQSTQFQFNSVPQSIISQPGLPKQPWRANLAPTPGRILASSALRLLSSWHQCALRRAAQGEATLVEGEEQCEAALLRVHSSATWQGRRGRKRKGRAVTTPTPTWRISVNFCSVQLQWEYMYEYEKPSVSQIAAAVKSFSGRVVLLKKASHAREWYGWLIWNMFTITHCNQLRLTIISMWNQSFCFLDKQAGWMWCMGSNRYG